MRIAVVALLIVTVAVSGCGEKEEEQLEEGSGGVIMKPETAAEQEAVPVVAASPDAAPLPQGEEPMLAEPGDWAADFNEAAIACYAGSMATCDAIWQNERLLMDTLLFRYGRTCGERVDYRASMRSGASCVEIFPGHE